MWSISFLFQDVINLNVIIRSWLNLLVVHLLAFFPLEPCIWWPSSVCFKHGMLRKWFSEAVKVLFFPWLFHF